MLMTIFLAIVFCAAISLMLLSAVAFIQDKRGTHKEVIYANYSGKTFLRKGSFPKPLFQKLLA